VAGPLENVSVIDWSTGPAAAVVTMVLADYGADVIRIDPPHGVARHQHASYQAWDRGKKSVVLDVGSGDGRRDFERLLARADVFVADDPDAVSRLISGSDDVCAKYPHLIYLCLSSDGRLRDLRPLDDTLVAARLGTFALPDGLRHSGWLLPTYSTASVALIGVVAALLSRVRRGSGQRVEVSMRDGLLDVLTFGQWRQERASESPPPELRLQRLMFNMYECGDGRFLQFHTGAPGRFWKTMQLLGLDDRISPSKGLLEMGELLSEEEFRIIETDVPRIMRTRDRDSWLSLFWEADICCQPVLEPQEAFADGQVIHNGLVIEIADPEVGPIMTIGPPVKMTKSPGAIRGPRPLLGEHTEEVLSSLGDPPSTRAPAEFQNPALEEPPLAGIRVIDFGQYIAGPLACRILADLGADVIKVEPTTGDTMRPLAPTWEFGNRGKRSIALNLKSATAQEVMNRLIPRVDVVGHNMRPGAPERLGIDYDSLIALNPNLIYCGSPGWGSTGPKAHHQSFQPVTGGTSGLYFDAGGQGNPPRRVAYEDYFNAALGAIGMIMALIHRERTGEGQYLESPQMNSGMFMMSHTTLGKDGRFLSRLQLDRTQMRYSALDGLYPTADGLLAISVSSREQFDQMTRAIGQEALSADPRFLSPERRSQHDCELTEILAAALLEKSAEQWVEALKECGGICETVAATPFHSTIWTSPDAIASGQIVQFDHPVYGSIKEVARIIGFSRTPCTFDKTGPLLGEHTREILSEVGYRADEVDELERVGIIASTERHDAGSVI
jgi:crotonobetainyl-CoA:carnitine CoA-transferase CaiB-like acyl-CoA transferase